MVTLYVLSLPLACRVDIQFPIIQTSTIHYRKKDNSWAGYRQWRQLQSGDNVASASYFDDGNNEGDGYDGGNYKQYDGDGEDEKTMGCI